MSVISDDEHQKLQKDGANARALGRSFLDNPYLRSDHSPRATGMRLEEWTARHDAWDLGWHAENLQINHLRAKP